MDFVRENRGFLLLFALFVAIPFVRIEEYHLLLFNFPHHRFEIAGFAFETGTYALIGILLTAALGATLITALSLSRFYCGTLCPNTLFARLLQRFGGRKTKAVQKIALFSLLAPLSFAFSFSAVSYGIDTAELAASLYSLSFAGWLAIFLSILMLAEIYMVQGWYCAYLCPYGAISAVLPTEDRLAYRFDDPNDACIRCGACVKVCPIPSLDIREGFDTRCIQCGLCETACAKTFAATPGVETLITHEKRSLLRAAGRGKGFVIAVISLLILSAASIIWLSDEARLDACLLENRPLYIHSPGR